MFFIQIGIIFCMLTVMIGAFGAHFLVNTIGDKMDTFKTGIQYELFHSLALIITGILSKVFEVDLNLAGYFFIAGIILFSGSLYLISIYKYSFLGMVTPIGGLSFIIGWALLVYKIGS